MTTTPAPVPPSSSAPALDRFFDALRRSPVRRSRERVLAGVCAGVAQRLGVSTAIVRVVAVVAALLLPVVALYLAAWLLLPDADGRVRLEGAVRRGEASSIVLLVLAVIAVLPDAGARSHVPFGLAVVGALVVGAFVLGQRRRRSGSAGAAPSTWTGSAAAQPTYPAHPTAPTSPTGDEGATGPTSSWPQDAR